MIIWLASYPKSGNTWLRAFISALIYSEDGIMDKSLWTKIPQFPLIENFDDLIFDKDVFYLKKKEHAYTLFEQLINAQYKLNLDNKIKIVKTHFINCKVNQFSFTDENNTLGTIHIVRDPRNVISSLKNHYDLNNYESACKFLFNDQEWLVKKENKELLHAPILLGSWGSHYNMWKQYKKNYLLIKYENLVNNSFHEFEKVKNYLENIMNIKIEQEKFENAIKSTSFDKLKIMEKKNEFYENAIDKNNQKLTFFKFGPKNKWENLLDKSLADNIVKKFKKEMKELDYI